jgi:hypothetical protein
MVISWIFIQVVHQGSFFLPFVAKLIHYNWAKTGHLQLMVFLIATT